MRLSVYPTFILLFFIISIQSKAQKLAVVPYVSGINAPIDLKHCGDDRLFVADRAGRIRVINADGTLRPIPFLDFTTKISSSAGEEGFLGMAFSPGYKIDGKFYVDYTSIISGQLTSVIEEYKVSAADSNIAEPSSALTILTQAQPEANHNGGNLMFGKDGYLYINFGDGGGEGDADGNAQNRTTFLGKILRIDINNSSLAQPYAIPSSNPFYNDATEGIKKEIWAYGVRNPWRSSVDRLTGDLWIADVGQAAFEEIDYQPAGDAGGHNYGWNITEANSCYNPATGCNTEGLTLPIFDYPHPYGNAVTGGYVYRSAQSKSLFGTYIFGDYVTEWIDGIRQSGGMLSGEVTHFVTVGESMGSPVSFGEDRLGDQYVLINGTQTVFKLEDTSYLRRPKAYFSPVDIGTGSFLLEGLQGKNLTYQWLRNNTAIPGAISPDYTTSVAGRYRLKVTNTLNFSDTSDEFTLGSLPLKLVSFTAQKTGPGRVRLQWQTASEQGISGYGIMRKQNNEATFSNIGFIKSQSLNGLSGGEFNYEFNDSLASGNSKLFYRLQIVNADGSLSWSDIRAITYTDKKSAWTFYPNPASGQVQVDIGNFTSQVWMRLYDNTGKKVGEEILNKQTNTVKLPSIKGIYIMQLIDKNGNRIGGDKLMVR